MLFREIFLYGDENENQPWVEVFMIIFLGAVGN